MAHVNRLAVLLALPALAVSFALTGCSGLIPTGSSAVDGSIISGKVIGGQPPITGTHVYLYSAGTTGYGSASVSRLTLGAPGVTTDGNGNGYVTTDGSGNFAITGDYTCPSSTSQMYLLAIGGNPGLATNTNNTAITLIAAVGNCSTLQPTTSIFISEVSTAAAVTALQQFMVDNTHIGTSTGNVGGLSTAFASVADLVPLSAGNASATPAAANGVAPQAKVNTLGNILAPCINSLSSASTSCASLFSAATPAAAGTQPNNVADAMLLIARNPGRNIATLYGLTNAQAPFQPSLTAAPNDFSLGVTYTGGGLVNPGVVVIDSSGNAWTANCPSCNGTAGTDSIIGFGPQGAVLSGATGYTTNIHSPQGIAFDTTGALWSNNVANNGFPDQVVRMNISNGTLTQGFPYSGSLSTPLGIALDAQNGAWVANRGSNSLIKLTTAGTLAYAPVTSPGFLSPTGVGIDNVGNVYAAGTASSTILKFNSGGTILSTPPAGYSGAGISQPVGISIDSAANVWTVDNGTNAISEIRGTDGSAVSPSTGYTPSNGIYQAAVIAIDGAGTAWISNCRVGCPSSGSTAPDNVLHLSTAGVNVNMSDGLQNTQFRTVGTLAIDASGNLWITNNQGGSVTKLIGVAVPVKTPLSLAVATGTLGAKP